MKTTESQQKNRRYNRRTKICEAKAYITKKKIIVKSVFIVADFNTTFLVIERMRQKIRKGIEELNRAINEQDIIIYQTLYSKTTK